jgi:adenosine deaminase CECR1
VGDFDCCLLAFSDDPSFWGAKPLSHDFYFAFLGMASARQDLRAIKRIILNSFDYSALNDAEKAHAKKIWSEKWNAFIKEYLRDHKSTVLV